MSSENLDKKEFHTTTGNKFTITSFDDEYINIFLPENPVVKHLAIYIDEVWALLESGKSFSKVKDITNFFGKAHATHQYSYDFVLFNEISKFIKEASFVQREKEKKYIFIIDEINRGEISKIFGELFFAIDPGYRGAKGSVSTQYSNLHVLNDTKFYIPDNVYIIGTMNDIDRSVESFDFAMRRRFRFVEITPKERLEMLSELPDDIRKDAEKRLIALNIEIVNTEGLNENYQIGPAYFLKLKNIDFDKLWTDYLKPLLQEYVNGMYDDKNTMSKFENAYFNPKLEKGLDQNNA